jgi:hypothetical protein
MTLLNAHTYMRLPCRLLKAPYLAIVVAVLREWLCPGGCPGLQNRWPVARSERWWVRLPSTPAHDISCRPSRALPKVISSVYSRSPPTGRPRASLVNRTLYGERRRCRYKAVESPSKVALVARMISSYFSVSIRLTSSAIFKSSGPTPSTGEITPCRTW